MKTLIPLLLAVATGTAAQAQDFYAGAALDFALPHSGDTQTVGTVIGGVGFGTGSRFNYGAEVEWGGHLAGDADYSTQRLRGWGTFDMAGITGRVSGGITQFDRDGTQIDGYNLGLGVERAISNRLTLRGEFIRDFMEEGVNPDVTTTRIGAVFNF